MELQNVLRLLEDVDRQIVALPNDVQDAAELAMFRMFMRDMVRLRHEAMLRREAVESSSASSTSTVVIYEASEVERQAKEEAEQKAKAEAERKDNEEAKTHAKVNWARKRPRSDSRNEVDSNE